VRDAEKTIIPALRDHKMRLLPYMPLASGLLSGKYRGGAIPTGSRLDRMPFFKGSLPQNPGAIDRLQAFAEARGIKLAQLALAWLAGNPIVGSVIAGATSAEQVVQNAAAGDIKLSAADPRGNRSDRAGARPRVTACPRGVWARLRGETHA
jgi:1-deoxyxylulose-5-phosphate synthase